MVLAECLIDVMLRSIDQRIMVQIGSLYEPVGQKWNIRLDQLKSGLLVDPVSVCGEQTGLGHHHERTEGYLQSYVVKRGDSSFVLGGAEGVDDDPLGKARNVVVAGFVVDVLLYLKGAICGESEVVSVSGVRRGYFVWKQTAWPYWTIPRYSL